MSIAVTFSPEAQCAGKRGFRSKKLARRVAKVTETRMPHHRKLEAYVCPHCSDADDRIYHVGGKPSRDAIATRLQRGSEDA